MGLRDLYKNICIMPLRYYKMSVLEYLEKIRMEKARLLLKNTDMLVYQVAKHVGFENSNYFINRFTKSFGISPTGYRKKYRKTM